MAFPAALVSVMTALPGCGVGDRDSSVRGAPATFGTYEVPSCALRFGEMLELPTPHPSGTGFWDHS